MSRKTMWAWTLCAIALFSFNPIGRAFGQVPPASTTPDFRIPSFQHVLRFEAERDFIVSPTFGIVETGRVRTHNDDNRAGDTLAGINRADGRGVALAGGVYRWRFRIGRMGDPAFLPASPVWTLSVWDVTAGVPIATRRIDASDLTGEGQYHDRFLMHSIAGREGHRFEARVTWNGMVNGIIDFVDLEQAVAYSTDSLESKALALDADLRARFLDPAPGLTGGGQIVARRLDDRLGPDRTDQRGDSFTWTALYTASQAMRLRARPGDTEALANMEQGFRTLTRLQQIANEPGVIPRYVDAAGRWTYVDKCDGRWKTGRFTIDAATGGPVCRPEEAACGGAAGDAPRAVCPNGAPLYEQWSSSVFAEDLYVALAFAVGQGYELIADPALKTTVGASFTSLVQALLDNDLRAVKRAPADGSGTDAVLDFNPYISSAALRTTLVNALEKNDNIVAQIKNVYAQYDRVLALYNDNALVGIAKIALEVGCLGVDFPNINGLLPPQSTELFAAIDAKDVDTIVRLLPAFLTQLRGSLGRANVILADVSRLFWELHRCVGRYPGRNPLVKYMFIAQFVDNEIRPALATLTNNIPLAINQLEDLKFDASNAITAASLLATASMIDGRFYYPYMQALGGAEKQLIYTMERWAGVDEIVNRYAGGDQGADRARADTNWKALASLTNLTRIEDARRPPPSDDENQPPALADRYAALLLRLTAPTRDEGNVLYDALVAYAGLTPWAPIDSGLAAWNLAIIPTNRVGMSKSDWLREIEHLRAYSGDLIDWDADRAFGYARDPIPSSVRALNNIFLWQRNPRKLGAQDYDQVSAPPLDYLLAYWTARAAGVSLDVPVQRSTARSLPERTRSIWRDIIRRIQ